MSPNGTIEVRDLWKRFRADRQRMLLRDELERLKNRLKGAPMERWRWVLRDINLNIQPGEAVGLIGSNGSGKSTLLKILTRVMFPYAGTVGVTGRIGALIEVRAGIHPDLTGRENAFLFGSLLGLSRSDVAKRFDAIADFAELDSAIDRQVKFYSSGMQMRLGFAVAAFLEPDVLLVDEVLAVGDAHFQQKCLNRMRLVLEQGTTLVLVSHDLAAVEAACTRGIWLDQGTVRCDSDIRTALSQYRTSIERTEEESLALDTVRVVKAEVWRADRTPAQSHAPLDVTVSIESEEACHASVFLGVSEGTAAPVFSVKHEAPLGPTAVTLNCHLEQLPLPGGRYYLWLAVQGADGKALLGWHPVTHFDVEGPQLEPAPRAVVRAAPVHVAHRWEVW